MKVPIHEARKAWDTSCRRGQMGWLEDTTFISADCFQPLDTAPPRSWKRIAVPPATGRHGDQKIFKRVVAIPFFDTKYRAAAAELDSQGFGARKRARTDKYLEAWSWGGSRFDPEYEDESTGGYDLVRARLQVKRAYKNIKDESHVILARLASSKRSTFPPVQLTWVPRKRHNTRWPVTPPQADAPLLAEMQPLIKFELHPGQIDDPAFWEQQDSTNPPETDSEPTKPGTQQAQKLSSRRRSIAKRPSLSTISEELREHSGSPNMTPTKSHRSTYGSPLKRWTLAADRYTTPTKVASSPLKHFTLTVTPSKVTFESLNDVQDATEAMFAQSTPIKSTNEDSEGELTVQNDTHCGSSGFSPTPISSPSPTITTSNEKTDLVETANQETPLQSSCIPLPSQTATAAPPVAVFDQPASEMLVEPEHETRRRVSFDNARRSDRRSGAKFRKRVRNWVTNTSAINRRHSIPTTAQKKPRENRRHTLDVDVGRNPDIFGQTVQRVDEEVCSTKQEATIKENSEMVAGLIAQDTAHERKVRKKPIHEETASQTVDSSKTGQEESVKQPVTTSASVRKSTPIDWDPTKTINETKDQCSTRDMPISDSNSVTVDIPTIVIASSDSIQASEPSVETPDPYPPTVEVEPVVDEVTDESPTIEIASADDDMTDALNVDAHDDSELSLLRNFVRRAQMKPKRRSSATFLTGSPVAKAGDAVTPIESPRVPLGEKDANKSPSPSKKRKGKDAEDVPLSATTKASRLVTPDLEDTMPQPQRKKRRKGVEMDAPDDILNPDMKFSQKLTQKGASGGLRRSKRVATSKPTELAVPSQIPVRLPGFSGMMSDADMPAVSTAGLMQRKTEKDLATLTRTNTRRNKGGAVPVPDRLADLLDVDDDTTSDPFCSPAKRLKTVSGRKAVRWHETLFRTQGEDNDLVATVMEEEKDDGQDESEDDAEDELQPPQMRTELGRPSNPVKKQSTKHDEKPVAAPATPLQSEAEKKKALRPRASRLPAAKKSNGLSASTPKRKTAAGAASSLPAPPLITKAAARSTAGATPISKRAGVLGVSLGTPAPKRRGGGKK